MFLAAVLNAYLQSAESADATPVIDVSANDDADATQGLARPYAHGCAADPRALVKAAS